MILLDTHAWIWMLAAPAELSGKAKRAINRQKGDGTILIASISVWELYMLVKKGRLVLKQPPEAFLRATASDARLQIAPLDEAIARRSVLLPDVHADPADRMILATAAEAGCPVVSCDKRFHEYGIVPVVW